MRSSAGVAPLRSAPWISAISSFSAPAKSPDRYCVWIIKVRLAPLVPPSLK